MSPRAADEIGVPTPGPPIVGRIVTLLTSHRHERSLVPNGWLARPPARAVVSVKDELVRQLVDGLRTCVSTLSRFKLAGELAIEVEDIVANVVRRLTAVAISV